MYAGNIYCVIVRIFMYMIVCLNVGSPKEGSGFLRLWLLLIICYSIMPLCPS